MIRYLTEDDVEKLLTMQTALEMVEQALRDRALGKAVDVPRVRARTPMGSQHILQAASPQLNLVGYKVYYSPTGGKTRFYVHLFQADNGKPIAILEASHLGMVRTGAASGVAARYLAREDAAVVAMIGAGKQAVGQLEAVCKVRNVRKVLVYSRTEERVQNFKEKMLARLDADIVAVKTPQEAVRGADIIQVITKAATPVLRGEWLEPGQHVNAAGSNFLARREIDEVVVQRSSSIVVDSRSTARQECGDLLPLVDSGQLDWDTLTELGEVITGRVSGRTAPDQITLYESHGMGIQDLYVAARVVALAHEQGVGSDLPIQA